MNSRLTGVGAELKTTRQLLVRFAHAPRVKLTLRLRPEPADTANGSRVLRIEKEFGTRTPPPGF
jgi:hypothetical protein